MKPIKLCCLFLCVFLLLPLLISCKSEQFDLLYEVEQNGLVFCARGKRSQVKQILVKENDEVIWSERVQTDRRMGKIDDTYGFLVQDLNFDGYDDILIATQKEGECISYDCYLRVGAEPQYELSETFAGLYNVRADANLKAIFAFEQSVEARGNDAYLSTDKVIQYFWKDGKLVPNMYAAIHYYSGGELTPYCYSVADYDKELGDFLDSTDKWLSKEEYESTDWSFFYYFK